MRGIALSIYNKFLLPYYCEKQEVRTISGPRENPPPPKGGGRGEVKDLCTVIQMQ